MFKEARLSDGKSYRVMLQRSWWGESPAGWRDRPLRLPDRKRVAVLEVQSGDLETVMPGLFGLLPGERRTGGDAVEEPYEPAPVTSRRLFQPVARNTWCEVQRRQTSCMGVPQTGHEARKG